MLLAATLGSSLAFMDGSIVNVALPALQKSLGASVVGVQWVVEAYALSLSALLLVGGVLGDIFGRRAMFAVGLIVFTGSSAWCGFSTSITSLILARGLQGVGGALLTPGSLTLITASFPEDERGKAIGTWSGMSGIAAAIGPVIGGFFIDRLSWRWAFFINLPLAALALFVLFTGVPESRDASRSRKIDLAGALLGTLGLLGLVYGLLESSRRGFGDSLVVASLLLGVLTLAAFVAAEARVREPMVSLALFRSRAFSGANLLTLFLYGALGGVLFFIPLNLIQVQGYSATAAGAAFVPFVMIVFLLSRWAGGLVDRHGSRGPLVVGPSIAAAGFALLAFPGVGGSYFVTFLPGIVVLSLGMAMTIAPLTTTVMGAVADEHAGVASGVNNAVSRAAGLVAVAALGIVMFRVFASSLDDALAALKPPDAIRRAMLEHRIELAAMELPAGADPSLRAALDRAVRNAFVDGFRVVVLIGAALSLLSAGCAAIFFEPKRRAGGGPARPLVETGRATG